METAAICPDKFADLEINEQLRRLGAFFKGKEKIHSLKKPRGAKWKLGGVDDTIYKGKDKVINGWGKFYLPKAVKMTVIGVIDGTSCPYEQLVLMICEDGALYAYDGEELHAVALNLDQLFAEGIEYPAAKIYYKGEAFSNMTVEQWKEVKKGAVGKRLDEEHHNHMMVMKPKLMENLKIIKQRKDMLAKQRSTFVEDVSEDDLRQLLVYLHEASILNMCEFNLICEDLSKADMARHLFDLVWTKGDTKKMITHLELIDPQLGNALSVS